MDALPQQPWHRLESPSPVQVARRVRAAFAYAGLDISEPVKGLHIDPLTIREMVHPIHPRGAASEDELRQIAEATGVPVGFLLDGFMLEQLGRSDPVAVPADRYEALRQAVADLTTDIGELRARIASQAQIGVDAVGDLAHRPRNVPTVPRRSTSGSRSRASVTSTTRQTTIV